MNLRHLKLWKRHTTTTTSDVAGDVSRSRDTAVDVRSPSSDSGYSDVAPTFSSMFSRQPGHHGHLQPAHRATGDRGRSADVPPGRRKPDVPTVAGQFRGLRGSSTPRSGGESTRRTPSTDVKSPSVAKPTTATTTTTLVGGVTVEAFFSVVREANVDKLRQFLRDTKFDVNARDTVCNNSASILS